MDDLSLRRVATRIEILQRWATGQWSGADVHDFKSHLPGGRAVNALPDPAMLRRIAERRSKREDDTDGETLTYVQWRLCLSILQRLEGYISSNQPHKRMLRDVRRGRWHPGKRY